MKKTYKFDTHIHTRESSMCSHIPAAELVEKYHAAGYDGIAITDHIYAYTTDQFDDWDDFIDYLMHGYKIAKKRGDEIGLSVILGLELRYKHVFCDFLIYGHDEAFLRANPNLNDLTPQEFYKRHGNDLLIIQAHPYRVGYGPVFKDCIHGVEVFNGNPGADNRNEKALALCAARPDYCPTKGSDVHSVYDIGTANINLDRLATDSRMFCELIKQKEYSL